MVFVMKTFTEQLVTVARAYAEGSGVSLSVVSHRVFDDSKRLPLVEEGGASVTLRRAEQALEWFSDNWPDGVSWPPDVVRPANAKADAA